jgi:hypothetical protein
MKRVVFVLATVFCVTLAIVVGNRLSVDATALVVGVACGVLASVPTSLLLIWALTRRDQTGRDISRGAQIGMGNHYPPVVVVNPGQGYTRPGFGAPQFYSTMDEMPMQGTPRQFKIIGDAETPGSAATRVLSGTGNGDW